MHLFFVDESGTPPKANVQYPRYFVMAGIVIPEANWSGVRDDHLGMKLRRGVRGELKWRYFAPGNDDAKNPMRKLAQDQRDEIRHELFGIIAKPRHRITSIAAVCSAAAAYEIASVDTQEAIYHLTYKVLSERFQYYLQDISTRSNAEFGIIVCDHRGAQDDKRLRAHHQMLTYASGGFTSTYANLVESLFLQPSHQSIGIQLADLVAGAVWRKFERDDGRFYDLIEPTLRRSSRGQVAGYGVVKVPKTGWR
jgi:hypothetical protein